MVIVAGSLRIAQGRRDEFVAASRPAVVQARATVGCLEFVVTADPVDDDRVVVYERWESVEALAGFRGDGLGDDLSAMIVSVDVGQYAVMS
ncbi:putative quinol monooxygenase [Actinokineospora sp. UTMC 2448]|uniref:putative quinol monooxygenase n=1 Tax=Actinokineospora sp. UTMC 2448 TaxID=2268449 RepID=UPI0021641B1A|nr:antibiotic biosynthesis monooxygenase [Actinokineospora sp. UTMC 2448]UVS77760.1 Antibiotic biosynthesis monooxygenase [Actinokineospora sp. UTMC 2448]